MNVLAWTGRFAAIARYCCFFEHYSAPVDYDEAENQRGEAGMDLQASFPVSGVETWVLLPPLVAFAISLFTSMGGVSGAFLLLPFQVTCLHFVSPSVSSTNFVYNIVAIPSGVYRYIREGRMAWYLAWTVVAGTLPGVFFGYYIRIYYLPDPKAFRLFIGCVLFYVGLRLLHEMMKGLRGSVGPGRRSETSGTDADAMVRLPQNAAARIVSCSLKITEYEFCGERFSFGTLRMLALAFIVGIVGGAYGIGGGAIIAPFCVTFFGLPVHMVAGAALLGTFLTSIAGVSFYSMLPAAAGISTSPDWSLGILFGLGGIAGMYCGARLQKYVPQKLIKTMLGLMMVFLGGGYIVKSLQIL